MHVSVYLCCFVGAGENFNILEYTDPEIDSSATEHQDKSLADQHQSASAAAVTVQDPSSSSSATSTESSLVTSGSSMSCASSTPVSAAPVFPETAASSAKPFSAGETSAAKCSVASEDAVKSEAGRASESSAKSVPTSGFMTTTDFQAKFLEFSQRKAAGVAVGQTAPVDDQEAAASASSVKVKKADTLSTPSTLKKSSPVAEDSSDPVEVKPSDGHSASSESQPELPTTSLPMQVDGCCDSSSDDDAEESELNLSDLDMTVPYSGVDGVDTVQQIEFMNEDEPELVEIWQSSVGLQVDGAADDETDEAKDDEEQSSSSSGDQTVVTDNQSSDGPEAELAATATDAGVITTTVAVETTPPSAVLVSSCSVSDAALVSVPSTESVQPSERRPLVVHLSDDTAKQPHLSTDVPPSASRNFSEDSGSVIAAPQNINVQESPMQPSVSKSCNVAGDTAAGRQCLQSDAAHTLVTGEAAAVTVVASSAPAPALVSELQSSSAHGGAPLASSAASPSQNPSVARDGGIVPSALSVNQPFTTTDASVASAVGPCAVTSSAEMSATASLQSSLSSSQGPEVAVTLSVEGSSVSTASQSYPVAASAIGGDPAAAAAVSAPGTSSAITPSSAVVAVPSASYVDNANSQASASPAFSNGVFQLRPEMQQHAAMQQQQQQFVGHPPRRMYLPPEFHMQQHRMMQRGMPAGEAGMMIPADQLPPHGPPPPYPNKQFAGPQTFWVRQQHPPSGMPPEWIRHSGEFVGHRPMPPGSQHEWSRPQMMPAEWSGRQRMQQEWVYFPQQPHHPSQAPPHQWVRPPYSNMPPGFQINAADGASMQADAAYNAGYQPSPRNSASSAAISQDQVAAQGIKSPGSTTPRPSSHPSGSPVPASPARVEMGSPLSRSHTPRSMSRSSTPQASMSGGSSGLSQTPDHVALGPAAAAAGSPRPSAAAVSAMPASSPVEQSSLPLSSYQAPDHVVTLPSDSSRSTVGDSQSAAVSAAEPGISQQTSASVSRADNPAVSAAQMGAFPHAPAENMIYMHRPPHGMPMSAEMRSRMGLPAGGQYIAPPSQGMYVPGHAGPGTSGMTFYRMPSSAASTHSAIGALLNQQRPPVGMPVHYPPASGAAVGAESRYQLIHAQDTVYLPHPQRHAYSSAVTIAGPSAPAAAAAGSFVLQHPQQRGPVPAESAGGLPEVPPNQASALPNSMQTVQTLRGPFRMPQQLGPPGSMPMGMRVAGSNAPVVYGPQRPVPPAQMRMIAAADMRPQMIHMPRSSVTEFIGPAYRPRPPGEQPLLLEDLLEQVCFTQFCKVKYPKKYLLECGYY